MPTHRQSAKRKTVLWQGAAVALLAAAGAAVALPQVRDALAPKPAPASDHSQATTPTRTAPSSVPQLQVAAVAEAMSRYSPWQPAPAAPPAPVEEAPVVAAPTPPAPAGELAYIGSIITPSSRSALIRIDANQQILSVGETSNAVTLLTVEPEYIEIEKDHGPRQRIDLASRVMLAPADPPKRPVAFRPTPNPGTPMAPGAAAFNNPTAMSRSVFQPGAGPGAAAIAAPPTFDQARAAALAAREAAAKGQHAVNPPARDEAAMQESRDMAAKLLADESLTDTDRAKLLGAIGITPGTPVESAMEMARKSGIEITPATAQTIERLANPKYDPAQPGNEKESK